VLEYLTVDQVTRLFYKPASLPYVRKTLNALAAKGYVFVLPGQSVTHPRVYTLTTDGYTYLPHVGMQETRRVRPVDERDKDGICPYSSTRSL
jgi:hypothetical protein